MDYWRRLRAWLEQPPNPVKRQRHTDQRRGRGGFQTRPYNIFHDQQPRHPRPDSKTDDVPFLDRLWSWLSGEPWPPKPKLRYAVRSRPYHRPIDPLRRAIDWLTMRSVYTFYVKDGRGWTGAAIQKILHDRGVKIGFHGVLHGEIFFEVPAQQAGLVELLLLKAGVPLLHVDKGPADIPEGNEPSAPAT